MNDDLEASRRRHPSAGGPPPAFVEAAQAVYTRRERRARHLAEHAGMTVEAARAELVRADLNPEVIAASFHASGVGVWWCTAHNDALEVCTAVPFGPPPYCAPVWTEAAHCGSCRVPEDQPHRVMCPRALAAGDPEGDTLESLAEIHERDPERIGRLTGDDVLIGRLLRAAIEIDADPCDYPEPPDGTACGRPMPCLMHESLKEALRRAPERAARQVDIGHGPETELCGAQLDKVLVFCTKAFGHVDPPTNDDAHYDHRAKRTWRELPSL